MKYLENYLLDLDHYFTSLINSQNTIQQYVGFDEDSYSENYGKRKGFSYPLFFPEIAEGSFSLKNMPQVNNYVQFGFSVVDIYDGSLADKNTKKGNCLRYLQSIIAIMLEDNKYNNNPCGVFGINTDQQVNFTDFESPIPNKDRVTGISCFITLDLKIKINTQLFKEG